MTSKIVKIDFELKSMGEEILKFDSSMELTLTDSTQSIVLHHQPRAYFVYDKDSIHSLFKFPSISESNYHLDSREIFDWKNINTQFLNEIKLALNMKFKEFILNSVVSHPMFKTIPVIFFNEFFSEEDVKKQIAIKTIPFTKKLFDIMMDASNLGLTKSLSPASQYLGNAILMNFVLNSNWGFCLQFEDPQLYREMQEYVSSTKSSIEKSLNLLNSTNI